MRADVAELRDLFVRLAAIPSPSREERAMAQAVRDYVGGLGLEVHEDGSAAASGCACGNLIVRVPGRGEGTPLALCAHLDTVPVATPPVVVAEAGVLRSDGQTILGADDKAAVAVLLLLLRDLALEPPPGSVEVVFTVGEEIGLQGAGAMDLAGLSAVAVFVFDSEGAPGTMITSAPSVRSVDLEFHGVAAHAGIEPENGRSAVQAAARAIAAMTLGRIDHESTANVGLISGGSAVNVVPRDCLVRAEVRSRDVAKVAAQLEAMLEAAALAAAQSGVDLKVRVGEDYQGYTHESDSWLLGLAGDACAAAGLEPRPIPGGGGSDANVFNRAGLPALTLGVGFEKVHSPEERIEVRFLEELYRLAHALVRVAGGRAA